MINLDDEIGDVDAIIIPGTRNSTQDAKSLLHSKIANEIIAKSENIPVVGICGGYQILGKVIHDENKKESDIGTINGLGLLDIESEFQMSEKIVTQSEAIIPKKEKLCGIASEIFSKISGEKVTGYEIHEGITRLNPSKTTSPLLNVKKGQGNTDGASSENIFGTYFHGIFHNYNFRREFLNYLRVKKGLEAKYGEDPYETQKDYSLNKIADIVLENLDMEIIDNLLFS